MSTNLLSGHSPDSTRGVRRMLAQAWAINRLMTATILLFAALIPVVLVAMVVDPTVITGVNGWIKPLKFLLSTLIYGGTFLWLLSFVRGRRRWVQVLANVTAAALLIEIALIIMQVLRNTTSHFNAATPFDAVVFSIMRTAITVLAVMYLILAVLLIMQRMDDRVMAWGLRLAVIASFAGMLVAFLMTAGPTPSQRAALEAGEAVTAIGAHSVGVEDGGPGLPLVGWSTVGGDLRIPHFVGLHGLQVLVVLAWLLTRPAARRRWDEKQRVALVWIGGLAYMGWTGLLTWQALRGQSIVAPDMLTWLAYAGLAGVTVLAVVVVGRRRSQTLSAAVVS